MKTEKYNYAEVENLDKLAWFKQQNLELLRGELHGLYYPGYPHKRLDFTNGAGYILDGKYLNLPIGRWDTNAFPNVPDEETSSQMASKGLRFDSYGRPLHPWIEDLLQPDIGVVTGRGKYWDWGANYTADPIIIRHDFGEPRVLMITRGDTGHLALPGGFLKPGQTSYEAALDEANEEVFVDLSGVQGREVYHGILSDLRATAHAWPETTAYAFDLPDEFSCMLPDGNFKAGDDADEAFWLTRTEIQERVIGPHKLLIELALGEL